jgi:hypothetical protein
VASTFQDFSQRDPRKNETGQTSRLLSRQYRGYRNKDPKTKQQKALPVCVIRQVGRNKDTIKDVAAGQLAPGAFYFAMRSCEYSKVSAKAENRRTKLLRLKNIRFFNRNALVAHHDPRLNMSMSVSITFEFQKNDERDDTVTMHRTGDSYMCPVVSWAAVVQRILSYPGCGPESPVNTLYCSLTLKFSFLSSDDMRIRLRAAVVVVGEAKLGFTADEVGTHSLRSGAAMSMYLAHVAVYTIMIIRRWSSDAFLRYIRKQVEMFSHNVSIRMLANEHFFTTPDYSPSISRHDPLLTNNPASFSTPRTNNPRRAAFSLHY